MMNCDCFDRSSVSMICARDAGANEHFPIPNGREAAMNSRPLMTVRIVAAPLQKLGSVPHGTRSIVPVAGGDFEGQRLRGKVLPGGGDWLLLRTDGVLELDLRITLETDDHAQIYMTFQGLRHGPPDAIAALGRGEVVDPSRYYFRTLPPARAPRNARRGPASFPRFMSSPSSDRCLLDRRRRS